MPIDLERVLHAELPAVTASWDPDDVIQYHLAVGAGLERPTDPSELRFCFEKDLHVLPSFGTVPVYGALGSIFGVPGLDIDPASILHGSHLLELHGPIPTAATTTTAVRIADVFDKGAAALVVLAAETRTDAGDRLFTNHISLFVAGEGGFGGERGPSSGGARPDRAADVQVDSPTMPNQALLYRLCGDKNPLHADPAFAARGGFDRPILHGLCSFGIACKAVVDGVLDGDPTGVASISSRFSGVVFPGETLQTSMWRLGHEVAAEVTTAQRGEPVLSQVRVLLRGS